MLPVTAIGFVLSPPYNSTDAKWFCGWFCVNFIISTFGILKLRRCYREFPAQWSGAWQLTLSDLLAIVFFCGAVMAICRSINSASFASFGAYVSLGAGFSFAIAMLFAARIGFSSTLERSLQSIVMLLRISIICLLGFICNFIVLYVVVDLIQTVMR